MGSHDNHNIGLARDQRTGWSETTTKMSSFRIVDNNLLDHCKTAKGLIFIPYTCFLFGQVSDSLTT